MKRHIQAVVVCLAGMLALHAQDGSLAGPKLGYVSDPASRSIRPLIGFPGAAYLGQPVLRDLTLASVGPGATRALIVKDGSLLAIPDLRDAANSIALPSEFPGWTQIAWAADATTAAIYSVSAKTITIIDRLDSSPALNAPIDISTLPGDVKSMALASGGQQLILGVVGESGGGLYAVSREGQALLLAEGAGFLSAAFNESGETAFAADHQSRNVWIVEHASTVPAASIFLDSSSGVSEVVSLAVTPGGQQLAIFNNGERMARLFDIPSRTQIETVELDEEPGTLSTLAGGLLLLNPSGVPDRPLFVLTVPAPTALYFVPAGSVN